MKATAKDLRFHSKELLDSVLRGEEIIITYRGKPTAKLIPINSDEIDNNSIQNNELFNIWKERKDLVNVNEYVRNVRKGRFF